MPDPRHLLNKWLRRNRKPDPDNPTAPPNDSVITGESTIDNLALALSLAQQVTSILQVAPFIAPAAALLSAIVDSYQVGGFQWFRSLMLTIPSAGNEAYTRETRRSCHPHIQSHGDICAAVLRMEATGLSDLIGRLKPDLEKYAALSLLAFMSIFEESHSARDVAHSQLSGEMDQLNQELDSFGARFRTNRLVELAINQSANARTMDKIHDMAVAEKLQKWLRNPPDVTQKQHDTEKVFKAGTGRWLLDGDKFIEWQDNAGFLWIQGPGFQALIRRVAGAGKSVLSSTAISTLITEKKLYKAMENSPPPPAVAFFYFDFRIPEAQRVEAALCRIVLQLSAQSPHPYKVLDEHYDLSKGQTLPTFQELHGILEKLLREIGRTYIVLDALDECEVGEFDELVEFVLTLRACPVRSLPKVSEASLVSLLGLMEEDIRFFVADEIKTKSKYKNWRDRTDQIVERIARKSQGMFRLAACLLLELAHCKRADKLEEVLENLPNDLFEAYERFLKKIDQEDWVYVEATLRWIMFSDTNRKITLTELTDAIAFDFSNTEPYIYKPDYRKANATAIFDWLEGLVIETKAAWPDEQDQTRVELAHASVQDYLLSDQFRTKFGCDLNEGRSHTFIARTCISYFLYLTNHPLEEGTILNYPLAVYAAHEWCRHLLHCHDRAILFPAAMRLLEDGSEQYKALSLLRRYPHEQWEGSPLYLCCQEGYTEIVSVLLVNNADINRGFEDRTPLMVASLEGHKDISHPFKCIGSGNVQPTPGDRHGTALQIALEGEEMELVQILLENGADPNLQTDFWYGSPLTIASGQGCLQMVHLLLENGADVNQLRPSGCYFGTALIAASAHGHDDIVSVLLENGADIATQGGSALERASEGGRHVVVALLRQKGAVLASEER
ncbi:hypothetical protein DFH07DRAFT_1030384 [Mycena maculata]|uniref:Nephrocystin 3-like N-terminal domain-containing protein n=1 Tax=Mycena maculata TaxID=230809 RepID=A0AAD7K6U0_9AGAR|nr:hypothetical protein DFH07DRAFT_1030384 [Mycena maculata]